jgi:hypothetical protein
VASSGRHSLAAVSVPYLRSLLPARYVSVAVLARVRLSSSVSAAASLVAAVRLAVARRYPLGTSVAPVHQSPQGFATNNASNQPAAAEVRTGNLLVGQEPGVALAGRYRLRPLGVASHCATSGTWPTGARLTSRISGGPFPSLHFGLEDAASISLMSFPTRILRRQARRPRRHEHGRFLSGYTSRSCEAGPARHQPSSLPPPTSVCPMRKTRPRHSLPPYEPGPVIAHKAEPRVPREPFGFPWPAHRRDELRKRSQVRCPSPRRRHALAPKISLTPGCQATRQADLARP